MSPYNSLQRDDEAGVAIISFDHPPINLLDRQVVVDLLRLVKELEQDSATRVVLFRSANPDFFIAHFDLAGQVGERAPALPPAGEASLLSALFSRFARLPQVTIGELQGRARGAGSEFLLSLDMRFASRERALLGQPEVAVGLHPGAGGTVRLAQMLGRGRALEVCLSGDDYDAETAERYGWINRALADAELRSFTEALARRIASFPAAGIAHAKAVVGQCTQLDSAALADESQRFIAEMASAETVRRVEWMLAQGGQADGELERHLGALLARYPEQLS
ncbi:enoyl-CoA hydratase/isomerase family protein [Pseudomonas sp. 2FE]|uniref:enoyl-CoA hydratase/isomerase family protein n=1 Tax=Pseudomonas sp. 2FE TaxID=2502190 RepID=UPI0010F45004|nr:enoyl-CoA hydratase/isomerase family protein [Pseudomonas sp. 2FE]